MGSHQRWARLVAEVAPLLLAQLIQRLRTRLADNAGIAHEGMRHPDVLSQSGRRAGGRQDFLITPHPVVAQGVELRYLDEGQGKPRVVLSEQRRNRRDVGIGLSQVQVREPSQILELQHGSVLVFGDGR